MRIAVSAETDAGLDSRTNHHFGRCAYYAFVDVDGHEIESVQIIPNPFAQSHQPGMVPQFIRQQGADVMLSGGMGYRAIGFFEQLGVQVATGASGSVGESVQRFLDGELSEAAPCSDSVAHRENGHHHGHH